LAIFIIFFALLFKVGTVLISLLHHLDWICKDSYLGIFKKVELSHYPLSCACAYYRFNYSLDFGGQFWCGVREILKRDLTLGGGF